MRTSIAVLVLALSASAARSETAPCPGNADALGTARILPVDATSTPRVGRKHFPQTLALAPRELVLTFDDGPEPGTTGRILDALRLECVRASFFLLGRNALAHPELARRELNEGHTVAHHTFSHPLLDRMPVGAAEAEIDRGFAAVDSALYGRSGRAPRTPFFRFPGFASSAPLLDLLQRRGIVVFGADLWASDWNPMSPASTRSRPARRQSWRNCAVPRYPQTDRGDAAGVPAWAQAAGLWSCACRPGCRCCACAQRASRHRVAFATDGINRSQPGPLRGH